MMYQDYCIILFFPSLLCGQMLPWGSSLSQLVLVIRSGCFYVSAFFFLFALPSFLSHDSSLAAGSYVALTVLGRPPGLPQIPLGEEEQEVKEERAEVSPPSSVSAPHPPALPGGEQSSPQSSSTSCSLQENITSSLPDAVRKENKKIWGLKTILNNTYISWVED